MKRLLLSIVLNFTLLVGVFAQKTVTGTVTDTKGEPLYGVTISVKNGKHHAVTDQNGHYSLQVDNEAAVLVFRFIGMEPFQATAKGTTLNVKLKEQTTQLAETVVEELEVRTPSVSTPVRRLSGVPRPPSVSWIRRS